MKRKTGLLMPVFGFSETLGWSITAPYFFNLAPNYDLTLAPTYYSRQGFLVDGEWRHRLSNGQYSVRVAGISQNDPEAFLSGDASPTSPALTLSATSAGLSARPGIST